VPSPITALHFSSRSGNKASGRPSRFAPRRCYQGFLFKASCAYGGEPDLQQPTYCTYSCGLRGFGVLLRRQGTANVGMQRKSMWGGRGEWQGGGSSINQSAAWCSTQSSLPKGRHQNFALLTLQAPCRPSLLTLQFNLSPTRKKGEGTSCGPAVHIRHARMTAKTRTYMHCTYKPHRLSIAEC
jgi:hypothetical protein